MPRRARLMLPNVPVHVIQRGNNRQACFFTEKDYCCYLDWLEEYAERELCLVHAYVLMTNHVHLLVTPQTSEGLGQMMKRLGQRYVQHVNRTYRRSGTLWEGRYRSCLTQQETYVLSCYRYIELNPVRAGMVSHPADYPWSSYRINAQGEKSSLVKSHGLFMALSHDDEMRRQAYRGLFRDQLEPGLIDEIRKATNGHFVLGNKRFADEVSKMLKRRVTRGKAGRPSKRV